MQLTITIKDKLIKGAISDALDNEVYEYFDSAAIKAAKIPAISTATKEIFEDPKFQAQLAKELKETAEQAIEEYIYDVMDEINIPQIGILYKAVRDAEEKQEAVEVERQEAEEVKRMIKILSKAGFKIEKA